MEERRLQQGLCGFYYEPKHLIVLDETMLDFQKRCTLCHELVHAHNHDQGCSPYVSKAERREDYIPPCDSSTRMSTR